MDSREELERLLKEFANHHADYILRVLERIEQSLLRIEKLLEKEL